jgi:hypothetical protein
MLEPDLESLLFQLESLRFNLNFGVVVVPVLVTEVEMVVVVAVVDIAGKRLASLLAT